MKRMGFLKNKHPEVPSPAGGDINEVIAGKYKFYVGQYVKIDPIDISPAFVVLKLEEPEGLAVLRRTDLGRSIFDSPNQILKVPTSRLRTIEYYPGGSSVNTGFI